MKTNSWLLCFIVTLSGCSNQCNLSDMNDSKRDKLTWYKNDALVFLGENILESDEEIIKKIIKAISSKYNINMDVAKGDFAPSPGIISISIYDGDFSERRAIIGREQRSFFNVKPSGSCTVYNNIKCGKTQYSNVLIKSKSMSKLDSGDVSRCIEAAISQDLHN